MHRMATTAAVTLKNVPAELYAELKASAVRNRRSLNQEAIAWLEERVRRNRSDPRKALAEIRRHRAAMGSSLLTDEWLETAKNEGRR